jgi:phosphoribulokinase
MLGATILIALVATSVAFQPFAPYSPILGRKLGFSRKESSRYGNVDMALAPGEKVVVIGVAADSGCGKSTFMRRLTKVFGGKNPGPLGGGFGTPGGWETNTLVSDRTTVICLDDYHLNDRQGRKVSGLTALNVKEQKFDLMAEQIAALKAGKSISKPIYNHVNGTIDTPETVEPTPIVIIEGLHPLVDERVRKLLDFTIYLDISDEIKFAWKIQRDMAERGWTLEQVQADIEKRKPDFAAYVAPQMQYSDVVISVLPSTISKEAVGKHLKVKLIQQANKAGLKPAYILDPQASVTVTPTAKQVKTDSGVTLASYCQEYYGHEAAVLEMDGKLNDINDFRNIEKFLANTAAVSADELSAELIKVGPNSPGYLDGTGLFQTLTALKLREYYEYVTGKSVASIGQQKLSV